MIAGENIHKLAVKQQDHSHLFNCALISLLLSSPLVMATPITSTLTCRSLLTDKATSCVEVQKVIAPVAKVAVPKTSPEIKNSFDEADALFGKRTAFSKKKKGKKPVSVLPTGLDKTPTPSGPVPIPYPNIVITAEEKKPVKE